MSEHVQAEKVGGRKKQSTSHLQDGVAGQRLRNSFWVLGVPSSGQGTQRQPKDEKDGRASCENHGGLEHRIEVSIIRQDCGNEIRNVTCLVGFGYVPVGKVCARWR